jgi:hypothetical protein
MTSSIFADRSRLLRIAVDTLVLCTSFWFIASQLPAHLLLVPTIANGGDMGSQYYAAVYLRDVLLPSGKIVGWCPGNYAGFPLFQFYFPLPFLLMVALGTVAGLPVAFKLVCLFGTFMLPAAVYLSLRLFRVPFPGPALGTLASLCFLFMEANSLWGGNIPSTLAGEFTFSFSLALSVLFLGALRRAVETERGLVANGLLVAGIGLSHGYTLLWSGLSSLMELVATRRWWTRFGVLAAVHGLAILFMAFWLIPLLAYSPWTTAFTHVWTITLKDLFPPILWPIIAVAVSSTAVLVALRLWRKQPVPVSVINLWGATGMALAVYLSASSFHVVDIRFLPFLQIGLCMVAAAGAGHLLSRLPASGIWPVAAALLVLPWVQSHVSFVPGWAQWNFAGYEAKPSWPLFRSINDNVRGDYRQPRVVYEHALSHEDLGTVRAFENLPLFSGRSTLEGLYLQAAPTAPFVFYIQSEISEQQSCPFPAYGCSRFDLDRGVDHLRMFNVSHLIARSALLKQAASSNAALTREATLGDYEIFRVLGGDPRYAVPLSMRPYLASTDRWKEWSYRWFKQAGPQDAIPVFNSQVTDAERPLFEVRREDPAPIRTPGLGPAPELKESFSAPDRLVITGCRPGHPVLIRLSYHPRWKSVSGEKIWLAGPAFMLVFPEQDRLELVFADGPPVRIGRYLSVLGLLLGLLFGTPFLRRHIRARWQNSALARLQQTAARISNLNDRTRRVVLLVVTTGVMALFAVVAIAARTSDVDTVYRDGMKVFDDQTRPVSERMTRSLAFFRRAQQLAPLSYSAVHSTYYESIALYRLENWQGAETAFRRLIATYPEAQAVAEARYHIGICRIRLDDPAGAKLSWQETIRLHPTSPWARYAQERLSELK